MLFKKILNVKYLKYFLLFAYWIVFMKKINIKLKLFILHYVQRDNQTK